MTAYHRIIGSSYRTNHSLCASTGYKLINHIEWFKETRVNAFDKLFSVNSAPALVILVILNSGRSKLRKIDSVKVILVAFISASENQIKNSIEIHSFCRR